MFRAIHSNAIAAIGERDGRNLPEVVTVIVESVLDTLAKPSIDVIRAGTWELGRRGYADIRYEDFEAAFVAAINQARRD